MLTTGRLRVSSASAGEDAGLREIIKTRDALLKRDEGQERPIILSQNDKDAIKVAMGVL